MATPWIRLDAKSMLVGWTASLPAAQYAAWVKFLLTVKMAGVRGSIRSGYFDQEWLRKNKIGRAAWSAVIERAVKEGAVSVKDSKYQVETWGTYQADPTNAERQADFRIKNEGVTEITERNGSNGRRDGTGRDRTGKDGRGSDHPASAQEAIENCIGGTIPSSEYQHFATWVANMGEEFVVEQCGLLKGKIGGWWKLKRAIEEAKNAQAEAKSSVDQVEDAKKHVRGVLGLVQEATP
jgi:hypothetical protein